ncbi:50S ribosomal protein L15, chloroplastic [Telopea speciosissima]|uniref:50S ribosomal protein L15, chloroplastic n=1 Tax=Telopea speciosissima TaxID=54955 RepID=UPI001CC50BC0|nr:50S ribosomal protein L15, chloroplastic [Telopea speciosissima]
MAALLSLSLPSPARVSILPHFSSPFKGNLSSLKTSSSQIQTLKFQLIKRRERRSVVVLTRASSSSSSAAATEVASDVRFRLDNLGPQPGSRKKDKRKGRGHAAGQGGSCGFGMRGQKSRSGPGVRKGFEGGQMPLYRRIPKLRGIAGGMHAGLPKFVPVNLKDIEAAGFQEGDEVSLESLKKKRIINPSGRERRLPLKILGEGELSVKLNIKARALSESAKEKLQAAGCSLTLLPGRKKWVKPSVAKNLARAEEYFARKRAAAGGADPAPASSDAPSA